MPPSHKAPKQYRKTIEKEGVAHRSLIVREYLTDEQCLLRIRYFRAENFFCSELACQSELIALMEILGWFFFLAFSSRPCFAETYWQKAWTNGHCPGKPETAHSAASPSAEGERRSPKPPAAYTRYGKYFWYGQLSDRESLPEGKKDDLMFFYKKWCVKMSHRFHMLSKGGSKSKIMHK